MMKRNIYCAVCLLTVLCLDMVPATAQTRSYDGTITVKPIQLEQKGDFLHIDIDMVKTVIRNLISNAIKFSNEGAEVVVSLAEEDGMAIVSVKDSGCGIDEENQRKLLHTDTHFSTFGTNNEEGSGLGLLLCKDFVIKNGGKLWFTSKKGEGSTFSFSIPLLDK